MSYKWQPLQEAYVDHTDYRVGTNRLFVEEQMKIDGSTFEEAAAKLETYDAGCQYWRNDIYQVQTRRLRVPEFGNVEMVHINIRRIDGAAIFDWRHRQLIKNELVGPECEAFELYPAESRLVDTSNKFHLWALTRISDFPSASTIAAATSSSMK
jgi:hypothetical protein